MAVFAKTVETGSFRAAALALGLSPSVVSHHVSELEASLEVALLYRTTRRLSLTDEGKELYDAARSMVDTVERGLDRLGARAASPSGKLSITAPAAFIEEVLFEDLAAFALEHPKVELALHFSDAQVDLLRDGLDIAIRAGALQDSSLMSKKLFDFRRTLVAAPSYLAGKKKPKRPEDIALWDWIHLSPRPPVATFARPGGALAFTSRLRVNNAAAALGLARAGLGVAMVPSAMAAREIEAGALAEVLPDWPLEAPAVHAVWPPNAPRTSLAQRLVAFLERRRSGG